MTIIEYQKAAMRTANEQEYSKDMLLLNAVLGLCGESGEVADMVKKHKFQGHDLDREKLAKELGDVAWYLSLGTYALGYDLETVLKMNIEKLTARYPDGFEAERSVQRAHDDV